MNPRKYPVWCLRMDAIIKTMPAGYQAVLKEGIQEKGASGQNKEGASALDLEMKVFLMNGLDDYQIDLIHDCSTSKQIWDRLESVYKPNIETELRRLNDLRLSIRSTIQEHICRLETILHNLKLAGHPEMPIDEYADIVLSGVADLWPNLRLEWDSLKTSGQDEKSKDHLYGLLVRQKFKGHPNTGGGPPASNRNNHKHRRNFRRSESSHERLAAHHQASSSKSAQSHGPMKHETIHSDQPKNTTESSSQGE